MNIVKKENSPFWWMDFRVNGKRVRKSTKRLLKDKKSAMRVAMAEYERLLKVNEFNELPEAPFQEAVELTLSEVKGQTFRIYKSNLSKQLKFFGSDKKVHTFTTKDVRDYQNHLVKEGLKNNSIRAELKALKRCMNRAAKDYRSNRDITWPVVKKEVKTRYLSLDEQRGVADLLRQGGTVTDLKAVDLMIFLLDTGMRLNEAIDIRWTAINMNDRSIETFRQKTNSLSMVPMTDRVNAMLLRKQNQEQPFLKMTHAVKRLLWAIHEVCNQDEYMVKTRGKATIHSLRDTYATTLLQRGMHLSKLPALLGHSSTSMSEKYAHLEKSDLLEEARHLLGGL